MVMIVTTILTLCSVLGLKINPQPFKGWICLRPHVERERLGPTLVGTLEGATLNP